MTETSSAAQGAREGPLRHSTTEPDSPAMPRKAAAWTGGAWVRETNKIVSALPPLGRLPEVGRMVRDEIDGGSHMIQAVLFDMDATLLDINLTAFIAAYAADVSKIMARISGRPALSFGPALARCYLAMGDVSRTDGLTNAQVFCREFERLTGIPLQDPAVADALHTYEREVLPRRSAGLANAHPMEGGIAAIERAREMGLVVALATNPSFDEQCIRVRMGWAGIADIPFARVSHMGNSTRLKPKARYYEEFVATLGLAPSECLMVGNDARRDFPRPGIGMRTAYVGHAHPKDAVWSGRMANLAEALPAIVDRINVENASKAI